MSGKKPRGYYVRGEFVATGSEEDAALRRAQAAGPPSKTELKARSSALQKLGVRLAALPPERVAELDLPTRLVDALTQLQDIHAFEGARRQRQYVGKLMRKLGDDDVAAIEETLDRVDAGGVQDTVLLHAAENWRERLLAGDAAVTEWVQQFPTADTIQHLRALVRQARADETKRAAEQAQQPAGTTVRHGRAWRELYQVLRTTLEASGAAIAGEPHDRAI